MLSMLDAFYRDDEDNSSFFIDKEIYNDKDAVAAYLNKFPVIHIDMKNDYAETLKRAGVKKIIYFGVSFFRKAVKVSSEIIS